MSDILCFKPDDAASTLSFLPFGAVAAGFPPCTIAGTLTRRLRLFAAWAARRGGSAAVLPWNQRRTTLVHCSLAAGGGGGGGGWGAFGGVGGVCDTALCWWRSPSGDIWTASVTQFTEYQMFGSPVVWIGEMFPLTAGHRWSVAPAAAGGRAARWHLLIGLATIKRIIMSRRGPTCR